MASNSRFIRRLCKLNPDITAEQSRRTSHWKIKKGGVLIGILPAGQAKEGLAENTKSAFRRARIRF